MFTKPLKHTVYLKSNHMSHLREGGDIFEILKTVMDLVVGTHITPVEELDNDLRDYLKQIDPRSVDVAVCDNEDNIVYELTHKSWHYRLFSPKVVITCIPLPNFALMRVEKLPYVLEGHTIYVVVSGNVYPVQVYVTNLNGTDIKELRRYTLIEDLIWTQTK